MLPATYKPLDLPGIEEGRFLELANADLRTLQEKLVGFVDEYKDEADKATATMTISIQLKCVDVKTLAFAVKAATKLSLPQRPSSLTLAISGPDDETGQPTLFVRKTGSDSRSPRQGKLLTNKGESIDPDTGEVLPIDGKSRAAGEQ